MGWGLDVFGRYLGQTFKIGPEMERFGVKTIFRDITMGGGPRATLTFHITDNIQLQTESLLYFQHTLVRNSREVDNPQIPVSQRINKTKGSRQDFRLSRPAVLFLVIRF